MVTKKMAKVLSFRYKILAGILIILAAGLVFLPKQTIHEGISPEDLLSNTISSERYMSTDELANLIVNQDPSFLLIDVRDEESYNSYNIPGSLNIPLEKLLEEDNVSFVNQNQYDLLFISNDNFKADQAWLIYNRLGNKNTRVLKGGINNWFSTIINPPVPAENMPATELELYSFRKAASMYFGVAYPEQVKKKEEPVKIKKAVVPVVKKKKMPVEGGC
jgi:rhodanese-related sulfurtransferase